LRSDIEAPDSSRILATTQVEKQSCIILFCRLGSAPVSLRLLWFRISPWGTPERRAKLNQTANGLFPDRSQGSVQSIKERSNHHRMNPRFEYSDRAAKDK
jgi:hypothetical protein